MEVTTQPTAQTARTPEQESTCKYWAFISYSRADEPWARWLHRAMETYKVPKTIAGTAAANGSVRPKRLFPLFRDRDELSSASNLSAKLRDALAASRSLIVICSPQAVASRWVNEEIRTFKSMGRADRVYCLIVNGEPGAARDPAQGAGCFPAALYESVSADGATTATTVEPIAADARPDHDGKRNALLKLTAGILEVGFDSLRQRDHERRIRQYAVASAVMAAAVITLAGLAYYAFVQKGIADREARAARAALSGQIAGHAQIALESFPQRSLLLAVQALRITEDRQEPAVAGAKEAILEVLAGTGGTALGGTALGGSDSPVTHVALSGSGRWVATATDSGPVRLSDLQSTGGAPNARALAETTGPVVFSASSRWLVTGGADEGAARLWDLSNDDPGHSSRALDGAARPFVFTRHERWLITAGADRSVRLWDLAASPAAAIALPPQIGTAIVIAASPDSHWLVTSGWNPQIRHEIDVARLWDLTAPHPETTGAELAGHTSSVSDAAFSPDGRWLVTVSQESGTGRVFRSDHRAKLWDLKSPKLAAIDLRGHESPIASLAVSADGKFLVTGSFDGTALVWNLAEPAAPPFKLPDHTGGVAYVAVHTRSESAATVVTVDRTRHTSLGGGPVARAWMVDMRAKTAEPTIVSPGGRPVIVSNFASSDDGRWALLADANRAFVLDLQLDRPASFTIALNAHEGEIATAAFAPGGSSVITGSADKTARLWRLHPIRPSASPTIAAADYSATFAMSPDSRWLLTLRDRDADASSRNDGVLWDLARGDTDLPVASLRGHTAAIEEMAYSADSAWLATGSYDHTARLWNLRAADPGAAPIVLSGHTDRISALTLSRDGRRVVTGSFDDTVRVWDVTADGSSTNSLVLSAGAAVFDVSLSLDGRWLAMRSSKQSKLWDLQSSDPARDVIVLSDRSANVFFTPDGRWLVMSGDDIPSQGHTGVVLYDLTAKNVQQARRVLEDTLKAVAVSPDSRWLVADGTGEVPVLWAIGDRLSTPIVLKAHSKTLYSVSFSADGRWMVSGGYDHTARLWDLASADVAGTSVPLPGHAFAPSVELSPDGHRILSSSNEAAFLWERTKAGGVPERMALSSIANDSPGAFTADGRWLITRNYDTKTVSLWRLDVSDLMKRACRVAGRNLTPEEWAQYLSGQTATKTCPEFP